MNLALSTLILFIFLLPGLAFRRLYYSRQFSKQYFKESFFSVFSAALIPALCVHALGYWVLFPPLAPDVLRILDLISDDPDAETLRWFSAELLSLAGYGVGVVLAGMVFGWLARWAIRKYKWDIRQKLFRYRNSWHYVMSGEVFNFPENHLKLRRDRVRDISFRYVDAIQVVGEDTYLYKGFLVDYQLSSYGGLDTISLQQARRRLLKNDGQLDKHGQRTGNNPSFYPIKGHLLILKYEDLRNINFTYWILDHQQMKARLLDEKRP